MEDCAKGVVQGIGLNNNNDWLVRDPMSEDWGRGEGGLKSFKGLSSGIREIPQDTFVGKPYERDDNIGIVQDEMQVVMSKGYIRKNTFTPRSV